MSTRCRIGIADGEQVTSIYCHHDGYPSHAGVVLRDHYATEEKVKALVALGDLVAVFPRAAPNEGEAHSYERPAPGVSVAYMRDRGEKGVEAKTHPTDSWPASWQAYEYLWSAGEWRCRSSREGDWTALANAINEDT